jgi:hypothetical protein
MSNNNEKKREGDGSVEKAERKKAKSEESTSSSFQKGTKEANWEANTGRGYIVRYVKGETCCESPWSDDETWPKASLPKNITFDPDDADTVDDFDVIGGVWSNQDHKLVAVWGQHPDDSHLEFYGDMNYKHLDDLETLTHKLCTEICPELIDCFDDGSGSERIVIHVAALNCPQLENFYSTTGTTTTTTKAVGSEEKKEK